MTGLAFLLVISAAIVHASWNLLTKQINSSGLALVWLFSLLTAAIYLPINLFLILTNKPQINTVAIVFMFGTLILHLVYFLMLQQGYRTGDLSVVYPLARGTGPMLSTLIAIIFLGEQPTTVALLGAGSVIGGVFLLSGGLQTFRERKISEAVLFGLLTGTIIASYTIWDKIAVSVILVPPLLLDYASASGRTILLAPFALREKSELHRLWHTHRRRVLAIAILNPLSYILILTAFTFAPVSYIAPAREVSTLLAVLMGVFLLKEGRLRQKLLAASIIMVGIILLALN